MNAGAYLISDMIKTRKEKQTFKIFVLGGSTAAGYPYFFNGTFPMILKKQLEQAFPARHIEMINLGMTAMNTFAVLDVMRDVMSYEPDAILIYAGHNEFYGAFGAASTESLGRYRPLILLYLQLNRFKLFHLMRNMVGAVKELVGKTAEDTETRGNIDAAHGWQSGDSIG